MSKTGTVRARIEPDLKIRVEHIFQKLGLSTTEAINLFYKQVELQQGLPFEVKIPNEITQKTLEKTDRGEELNHCDNLENMFEQLGM
ncbi:type II toxin-antitoxin system RelB/DinJ family antitoxin [Geminocystis sp. CENA526]|uniref:type II toxin-antitoxin system RelB/DinJ family antitoxin n=1 Tax=Geminocystis sp. CENA526 TaxID=1355871 RepID=UPI003D701CBC